MRDVAADLHLSDQLVYELYGLTSDEIKIVEAAIASVLPVPRVAEMFFVPPSRKNSSLCTMTYSGGASHTGVSPTFNRAAIFEGPTVKRASR